MSSDIISSAPEKKALAPSESVPARGKGSRPRKHKSITLVWVHNEAFDEALDAAETEWLTIKAFAEDPRFGGGRHPSGLQHAVDANRYGLQQARRGVTVRVPCGFGYSRECTTYTYPLWRIEAWVGYKVIRRPIPGPPPTTGPLKRSVEFTSPAPPEDPAPPPIPRPRAARDVLFIPPPLQPELETCGADSC